MSLSFLDAQPRFRELISEEDDAFEAGNGGPEGHGVPNFVIPPLRDVSNASFRDAIWAPF
jgi:hypothetical protein